MSPYFRCQAVILLSIALSGCFRYSGYKGDGNFRDNGWRNYSGRYELNLGSIDLASPRSRTYTIEKLPRGEFTVGIVAPDVAAEPQNNVILRIVLTDRFGQIIISEEGSLASWTAQRGFNDTGGYFYRRGESQDFPLPKGGTRSERLNVKTSGGWGTYFYSEKHTAYSLTVEIVRSNAPQNLTAHVRLSGWDR